MATSTRAAVPVARSIVVTVPIGLLGLAVVCDILQLASGFGQLARLSYWLIGAGLASSLAAVPFGLLDWLHRSADARARLMGLALGGSNLLVLMLFAASLWLRAPQHEAAALAQILSFLGLCLALMTGWLDGGTISGVAAAADRDDPATPARHQPAHAAADPLRPRAAY